MKNLISKLKISVLTLLLLIPSTFVMAATYDLLKPQEVEERAHIIVRGTYVFNDDTIPGERMFTGYEFMVKEVLKGEVEIGGMIVGLQAYDTSWVREHQERGGDFLLFAEKDELIEFYVPVLGSNGLIQILDDRVLDEDKKRATYFEKLINGKETRDTPLFILIGMGIAVVLSIVVKKRAKMY